MNPFESMAGFLMNIIRYSVVLLILLLALAGNRLCLADGTQDLSEDTLQSEIDDLAKLLTTMPFEAYDADQIKQRLMNEGYKLVAERHSVFDYHRIRLENDGEQKEIYISLGFFRNYLAYSSVEVQARKSKKLLIALRDFWKQSQGETITKENEYFFDVVKKNHSVYADYYSSIAHGKGMLNPIDVPDKLMSNYEELVSDIENSTVGEICGLGGDKMPGYLAIKAIANSKRYDLLENILFGFNPGGRIFAAKELIRLEYADGFILSSAIRNRIDEITKLNIPIETCAGCQFTTLRSEAELKEILTGDY
ncbi:MAG: hypothetical protein PHE55_22345 [Methylococcaceae bacterium]|nr:hypothetical protein [Methylococcaceae bacterium]